MGLIKDGTVTGLLPDVSFFAVNYPGYPPSISRAIETLGGVDGIAKARSSDTNYIELRFRPEDPYSHPAFGELHHSNNLLLHLSKRKNTQNKPGLISEATLPSSETHASTLQAISREADNQNAGAEAFVSESSSRQVVIENEERSTFQMQAPISEELTADIVARVEQAYTFDGMVDYQYVLAVHADAARNKKKRRIDPRFEKGGLMDIEQDDLMMLIPPLFSLKDMPEQLVLRPAHIVKAKQKQERIMQQQWEMDITPCFGLDFKIEEVPQKIHWEDKIVKGSNDWFMQTALSKLFEERPIWPKRTLQDRLAEDGLKITYDQLKRLLFRTAYYFGCGPYRTLWIRNGYDARKDPESRMFQRVDFRIPKPLRNCAYGNSKDDDKASWKDICAFKVVPRKKFSSLQLYDLQDEYIQEQIRKPPERTTCRQSTGWFNRRTFDRLRLHVRVRFLSLLPGDAARALVQSEAKVLERSKKKSDIEGIRPESDSDVLEHTDKVLSSAGTSNLCSKTNHENQPPLGLTSEASGKMLENADMIEEEEEDEKEEGEDDEGEAEDEEEDEEEEEMEDYDEPLPEGQRYGNASPYGNSQMDVQDSIPKNYLQQLLGKFPFTAVNEEDLQVRNKSGGTDLSDGEYAIYEQESDDDN